MSIKLMTAVWELDMPATRKLVLLALADNANDEGHCWPSITTISRKCSMGRSTVMRSLQELENLRYITRSGDAGKTTSYTVHPCQRDTSVSVTPVSQRHHTRVTVTPPPVSTRDGTRVSLTPRTIIEPSVEPSRNHHSRGARDVDSWSYLEQHIKPTYPPGIYAEAQWLVASKHIDRILAEGMDTPEGLASKTADYRAQCDALERTGTQYVTSPAKHFDPVAGSWRGPFRLPTKPETPMERIHRLNSPSRVLEGEVVNG